MLPRESLLVFSEVSQISNRQVLPMSPTFSNGNVISLDPKVRLLRAVYSRQRSRFPRCYPRTPQSNDRIIPLVLRRWSSSVISSILTVSVVSGPWLMIVYKDGTVCISILHPPGDDPNHYESSSERWSPVQSVEKILLSVMSMLAEPNDESGANIDACVCPLKYTNWFCRKSGEVIGRDITVLSKNWQGKH